MGTGKLSLSYGNYAVTMYDVDNKKPVAVFRSLIYASRYVFPDRQHSLISTKSIIEKRKYTPKKTGYSVTVTFRSATPEQKEQLGTKDSVLFDTSYLNPRMDKKEKRKEEKGNTADLNKNIPSSIVKERDDKVIELLKTGYNYEEICSMMNISQSSINSAVNNKRGKNSIVSIHTQISNVPVEKLKQMKVVIENRIKLLESR